MKFVVSNEYVNQKPNYLNVFLAEYEHEGEKYHDWFVEIKTIEDLCAFVKKYGDHSITVKHEGETTNVMELSEYDPYESDLDW